MPHVQPRQYVPWMTLGEVAARTGRSVRVLQRWARNGAIPAAMVGRIWLVAESDLPLIEAMPRPGRPKAKGGARNG